MKKIFLAVAIICFIMSNLSYAENVDLQELIKETQKMSQGQKSFNLVWWMPTEFWEVSLRNEANLTQSQREAVSNAVNDYFILAIVDAGISDLGSIIPVSKEKVITNLSLSTEKGKQLLPLADTEISSDVKNLLSMMKPLMGNMLGQFGQGIEFVCFQGTNNKGERTPNPNKRGSFTINYSDYSYKWRLPLGSLLPAKFDKKTQEEFPGNYIYNPYTGNKLIEK